MRFTLLLVASLVGGSTLVQAQESTPCFEEDLVVSAAVEPTEKRSTPASVTIISADEIEAQQATDVVDLLAAVTGLQVVQSGAPGQVASIFTRGTESDHTLVLQDGMPLNNPYFGGFNPAFLPTDGIERIEVVRGPFSALYGSSALGGVIQILSSRRDGANLRLEGGSNGYLRGGIDAGQSWGNLRLDVSGHLRREDGELDNSFFDSEELRIRATWDANENLRLGLWTRLNDSKTGIPLASGQPTPNRRIAWEERELGLPLSAQVGSWNIDALLTEVRYDNRFEDPDDPFGFHFGQTESSARRARFSVSREAGENLWFALGSEYERLEVDDRSSFGVSLDGAEQATLAFFGQSRYQTGPVTFDAGLRYDDNNVFGSHTSPRLGMVVEAGANWRFRGSYGEGFRAPSLGELFFPFSGNPELVPETSESWEVGIELERDGFRLSLTGFRNQIDNLIDFDFLTFTNINIGEARTEGLELEGRWRIELLTLRGQLTLLDAKDQVSGLPLLRRADTSASLGLTFQPGDWVLDLRGLYVGSRPDIDPVTFGRTTNESYTVFDLAARWNVSQLLVPYARVQNLADERYEEALGFPAYGRTFVGGLELRF